MRWCLYRMPFRECIFLRLIQKYGIRGCSGLARLLLVAAAGLCCGWQAMSPGRYLSSEVHTWFLPPSSDPTSDAQDVCPKGPSGSPAVASVGCAPVSSVQFSPDGKLLAWTTACEVQVWRVGDECGPSAIPSPFSGELSCLAFSPDGHELAAGALAPTFGGLTQGIALWEVATGRILRKLQQRGVVTLAFSPSGRLLASGSAVFRGPKLIVWDADGGRPVWQTFASGRFNSVEDVQFSPDGSKIAASNMGRAYLLDPWTGKVLRKLHCDHSVLSLAFSASGSLIAGGGPGGGDGVCIWDAATGKVSRDLQHQGSKPVSLAFSPDGRWLALGAWDGKIYLWDVQGTSLARELIGHSGYVNAVAFSPGGKLLASGSLRDLTIRVWDPSTGREIRRFGP